MVDTYKPLDTSMDTYKDTETELFNGFRDAGVSRASADFAAKAVTQYLLGYFTFAGMKQYMRQNGVSEDVIEPVLASLQNIEKKPDPSGQDGLETACH